MNTKIIITDGRAEIHLEAETLLEKQLIDKIEDNRADIKMSVSMERDNDYYSHLKKNHRIVIRINELDTD